MATSTPNYGLKKFESGDAPDLPSLAASMDKIDTELKKNETNIGLLNGTAGALTAGTDLDTVVTTSLKQLPSGNGYTNTPSGFSWGILLTLRSGTFCSQMIFTGTGYHNSRIAYNVLSTPVWSEWR